MSVSIRESRPADDEQIVAQRNAQEADGAPMSVELYREERGNGENTTWVAVEDGHIVGTAVVTPAWWTGNPAVHAGEVRVDTRFRQQGTGTALFETLRESLRRRNAQRLLTWLRDNELEGIRFASGLGFVETGQVIDEYRLHVPDARRMDRGDPEGRLSASGILLASLAELPVEDERFLRAVYRLWVGIGDEPEDEDALRPSFDSWQARVLGSAGMSAETFWVALEGERPVGLTLLKRLTDDAAENDYTGVASSHRGRGIATALKWASVAWAQRNGVEWFYTSSEIGNDPMIAVNTGLGYVRTVRRREMALSL